MEMYYFLLAYAQNMQLDRSIAEDAVQETFQIACTKADNFLLSPNPKGWLLNTLKNVSRNKIRKQASHKNIVVTSLDIDKGIVPGMIDVLNVEVLYSDFSNNKEFNLLKKVVIDRKSITEVAQEIGVSIEACKKRVQRAKQKLKKQLEKNAEHSYDSWDL
ncbi:sigma-70 family RNA polymerase sigma factor [Alkalihalobacillus oceani]|uniref:RNA polymerase sigma factor n=1 Tax=Halalkalibacter oceani TaxID=1653776 RepID=UPI0020410C90|nr:sigma-70 family RNA polymerase sigma factor [Halalkalibacter oceani]MCM3762676.1 sigma-70 family RNA polymerase sigma factor [Halalkalibacter oceani]